MPAISPVWFHCTAKFRVAAGQWRGMVTRVSSPLVSIRGSSALFSAPRDRICAACALYVSSVMARFISGENLA